MLRAAGIGTTTPYAASFFGGDKTTSLLAKEIADVRSGAMNEFDTAAACALEREDAAACCPANEYSPSGA
jgi:hypothetical protein